MSFDRLITFVDERLTQAGISYMATGSIAGGLYGLSRATFDFDVVIDAEAGQLANLIASIRESPGLYISEIAADEALRKRGMFNIVDHSSGLKVDLIFVKDRPFSRAEFARRTTGILSQTRVSVVTLEDAILSKLEWAMLGESERQYADALTMSRRNVERLDRAYLRKWSVELGVSDSLERLFRELDIVD